MLNNFSQYRRVALITLDLIWDHFLALYWDQIEANQTLPPFIRLVRQQIELSLYYIPLRNFKN